MPVHNYSIFLQPSQTLAQKVCEDNLIEYFLYPKFGPGQMWETVAKKVKKDGAILKPNNRVIAINIENNNR